MSESLDPTADVAVRLCSMGEAGLLKDAVQALLAILLAPDSGPVELKASIPLLLEADDAEALLVDFLNELIFLLDTKRFLVGQVEVEEIRLGEPSRLRVVLQGETHDPLRHLVKTEVKAATFHGMLIVRTCRGVEADVVFDV